MRIGIVAASLCVAIAIIVWGESGISRAEAKSPGRSSATYAKVTFWGKVEAVDPDREILVVRMRGGVANFDLSSPVLVGYRSVFEIKSGDIVDVRYVESGIRIARVEKGRSSSAEEKPPVKLPEKAKPLPPKEVRSLPRPTPPVASPRKLQRRPAEMNHDTFEYADTNKDGRLSPVELATVIKELTMEEFRHYDKNRNASVDKSEFLEAIKYRKDVSN